jgi:hypothetical protein
MKQETLEEVKEVKDLAYYKANAEEDYLQVPISVLRYISQLEQEQDKNKFSEEMEMLWLKYRAYTSNEDAWSFKEWLVEQFKNK